VVRTKIKAVSLVAAGLLGLGTLSIVGAPPASAYNCTVSSYTPYYNSGIHFGGETNCSTGANGAIRMRANLVWDRTWPFKDVVVYNDYWGPWVNAVGRHTRNNTDSCAAIADLVGHGTKTFRSRFYAEGSDGTGKDSQSGGLKIYC
jgi:hypothetical protein